jgi:hypothetical protein
MSTKRVGRPVPLVLSVLVAFASALAALAVSSGSADAHGTHAHRAHAAISHGQSSEALALHDGMRKLWEDHITWTRLAIISLEGDTPDTEATVARLLQNQTDIGDAVKPFYGDAAGNQLTQLLREHILIAAGVIAAAKAGNQDQLTDAQARWLANADEIAAFLHDANPRNWPLDVMQDEMHRHLALTTDEAVAHLQGDWEGDVAAYDRVHDHILHMADLLSDGLIKQFPQRFR